MIHYLDYQATTPLAPEARAAMLLWMGEPAAIASHANPSSAHRAGRAAAAAVEVARDQVAALLPPGGTVYFTSGATEALNWALSSVPAASNGVAALSIEHAAVLACVERANGALMPVDADGILAAREGQLDALIPQGGLVSCMAVNNEVGTIQPIAEVAAAAKRRGALFLCDAVQGYGRVDLKDCGADLIAVSAHKVHGPKGIGALWVRDGVHIDPMIVGAAQERGYRAGTVSPMLCAGFGAAAQVLSERQADDAEHSRALWDTAVEVLDGWTVNGSVAHRYRGNLNVRREGVNGARLLSDARDVAFSLGSACASGSGKVSHVLRAMGLTEGQARSSIRLSWGRYTTPDDLRAGLQALKVAAALQGVG